MRFLLPFALACGPAFADCPAAPDHTEALGALIAQVQAVPNEMSAQVVTNEMWELWATAPDAEAQDILDRGLRYRAEFNLDAAVEMFDALITYCPDYAEGYNQRAFVRFIRQDFDGALIDLEMAIDRSPTHIAAIAGKALTLFGLGREDEGQVILRQALALNPWLPERRMLREMPKDGAEGEDL